MFDNGRKFMEQPLRVTYYGRVSTESDIQLDSLSHQEQYFQEKIKSNPRWAYVPGYADEGISGTSMERRVQFMRMIADAKAGRFDMVITKEVSRFARDIVDTVQTCRDLLSHNVYVFFEDMGLCTAEPDAEFRLSIMASVAQEESRKISERVKFGYRQTSKNGKRHGASAPIGYVFNDENDGYSIDPDTAPLVEYVFSTYARGEYGFHALSKQLAAMGYLNKNGAPYADIVLKRMINNPTYMGYIVNGKSRKESYRSNRIIPNAPESWLLCHCPQRVEPLVSREVWEKANRIAAQRREQYGGGNAEKKGICGVGKYAYSGRIECGRDGARYSHIVARYRTTDGEVHTLDGWRCGVYIRHGAAACDSPTLYTRELNELMRAAFEKHGEALKRAGEKLAEIMESVLSGESEENEKRALEERRSRLEEKKAKLIDAWLEGILDAQDCKAKAAAINGQIEGINRKIAALPERESTYADIAQRAREAADLTCNATVEEMAHALVRKIVVERAGEESGLKVYIENEKEPVVFIKAGRRFSKV